MTYMPNYHLERNNKHRKMPQRHQMYFSMVNADVQVIDALAEKYHVQRSIILRALLIEIMRRPLLIEELLEGLSR